MIAGFFHTYQCCSCLCLLLWYSVLPVIVSSVHHRSKSIKTYSKPHYDQAVYSRRAWAWRGDQKVLVGNRIYFNIKLALLKSDAAGPSAYDFYFRQQSRILLIEFRIRPSFELCFRSKVGKPSWTCPGENLRRYPFHSWEDHLICHLNHSRPIAYGFGSQFKLTKCFISHRQSMLKRNARKWWKAIQQQYTWAIYLTIVTYGLGSCRNCNTRHGFTFMLGVHLGVGAYSLRILRERSYNVTTRSKFACISRHTC